jgi:UDP-N-acetylmuramoylalanine--D-glutamate ligase
LELGKYVEALRGRGIAVIGAGVSNAPLIRLLLRGGCDVTVYDVCDREKLGDAAARMEGMGARLSLGEGYLDRLEADVIFRTPGMRPDDPALVRADGRGCVITSEMEAFFEVCPCMTIGVTGSDGKTTTATITAQLLRRSGTTVHLGGNIGAPLLAEADGMSKDDIAVIELSSFQLMTMKRSPDIAVITNITPNHLDYHSDMDEYVNAKRNIFIHQGGGGIAVFNRDDALSYPLSRYAQGEIRLFGTEPVANGAFLEGGIIKYAENGTVESVLDASEIKIRGAHNVGNFMAAITAARGLTRRGAAAETARSFGGVEHGIEFVRERGGAKYYNDSIASSPARTAAGLRSFAEKVILIAGGKDKGVPFDSLAPEIIARVKTLVLTGLAAEKIRDAVVSCPGYAGEPEIIMSPGFADAVRAAAERAKRGDTVLLSPACTSFDVFANFEERGNCFKEIVNGLD